MPTFELTSPKGETYRVDAPEGATEQQAQQMLQRKLAGLPSAPPKIEPPMSAGDQAADIAKSAAIGPVKGAIGLAGAPGDIQSAGSRYNPFDWLTRQFEQKFPETAAANRARADQMHRSSDIGEMRLPTSSDIQKKVEGVTGEFYEPKTRAGRAAQTVGEFAPAALAGPGGIARKVLGQAVVPGLASEAAGQATEGTKAEPYARMGAGVMAGFPFGRWRSAEAKATSPAPLAEELFAAGSAQYKAIRDMDLRIKPGPIGTVADGIANKLATEGFSKINVPETFAVVERLQGMKKAPSGAFASGTDFDSARQELLQATRNATNRRESPAAWAAINELDKYLSKIPAADVLRGDGRLASEIFGQARGNWAAAKRLEMLGGKVELGELNAATSHSGMNTGNSIRQAVKQLIRPNKYGKTLAEQHGFSEREIGAMNEIARGTAPVNTLRYIGNLLGGGGGLGQFAVTGAGIAAGVETKHPELFGLGLVGLGARNIADRATTRQARKLMENVARRSPEGGSGPMAPAKPSERGRTLGSAALRATTYGGTQ